jgi:tRNA1(Val) A37 N6-methylase TrmN6
VLLLLLWRFPDATAVGVEAQATSVDLARRSLIWNGAAGRAEIRAGDFRDPRVLPDGGTFPLVTGTPPYLPLGTAVASRRPQVSGCHLEERGGIEVYCEAAARVLAPGGSFVACESAPQAARVERAAAAAGLAIAARRDVIPRAGKAPLFTVWTMTPGAGAAVRTEPALFVRDAAGRRTDAFRALRDDMGMPP